MDPESIFLSELFAAHIIGSHRVLPLPVKSLTTEVTDAFKFESMPYVQSLLQDKYKEEEDRLSQENGDVMTEDQYAQKNRARQIVQLVRVDKQDEKRMERAKEKAKRVASYLMSNESAFANLETPSASLKLLTDSLTSVAGLENIGTEVYVFALNGFEHTIELDEKSWSAKMICRAVLVVAFGVAQMVFSAYLELKSFGLATPQAAGFFSEGVSDVLFGLSALWTGKNFTWADYRAHKLESIKMTAVALATGAFFSKIFNCITSTSFGSKIRGSALIRDKIGTSRLTRKVVKNIGTRTVSRIGFGLASQGVEQLVQSKLRQECQSLGKKLVEDVKESVDKIGLGETLGNLYQLKGAPEAGRVMDSKVV